MKNRVHFQMVLAIKLSASFPVVNASHFNYFCNFWSCQLSQYYLKFSSNHFCVLVEFTWAAGNCRVCTISSCDSQDTGSECCTGCYRSGSQAASLSQFEPDQGGPCTLQVVSGMLVEEELCEKGKRTCLLDNTNEMMTAGGGLREDLCRYSLVVIWISHSPKVRKPHLVFFSLLFRCSEVAKMLLLALPCLPVCLCHLSACKNSRMVEWIFMKFDIWEFHYNLSTHSNFVKIGQQ
jgi:hypothetical protein